MLALEIFYQIQYFDSESDGHVGKFVVRFLHGQGSIRSVIYHSLWLIANGKIFIFSYLASYEANAECFIAER